MLHYIKTQRLCLQRWNDKNLDAFHTLTSNPLVVRWVDDGRTLNRKETADRINQVNVDIDRWGFGIHAVVERNSDAIIGWAGLIHSQHAQAHDEAEILFVFSPSSWGKGYATEILNAMVEWAWTHSSLQRIVATVYPQNLASQQVMHKHGFQRRGNLIDATGLQEIHFDLHRQPRHSRKTHHTTANTPATFTS
ncbi:GNAT family N-acetyltransferase [Chitinimonas sp. BJB300]|uniref:GNAT family N-acetyltransferase n=1 Tax=Chitinimonas sp. BJB300 TaxID=1559339 RepID=UPI000C1049C3|nr:GNAT family N-acetyltransferase [Chitinimonas sp. BJB300]PHV10854.1 hypothetical protein CSQ89_14025 [Chitinimonas sp. BJB300]TSJ83773.1 GNAT family N-acetyltransferase [Chitinimonas sp. BJB300]